MRFFEINPYSAVFLCLTANIARRPIGMERRRLPRLLAVAHAEHRCAGLLRSDTQSILCDGHLHSVSIGADDRQASDSHRHAAHRVVRRRTERFTVDRETVARISEGAGLCDAHRRQMAFGSFQARVHTVVSGLRFASGLLDGSSGLLRSYGRGTRSGGTGHAT